MHSINRVDAHYKPRRQPRFSIYTNKYCKNMTNILIGKWVSYREMSELSIYRNGTFHNGFIKYIAKHVLKPAVFAPFL